MPSDQPDYKRATAELCRVLDIPYSEVIRAALVTAHANGAAQPEPAPSHIDLVHELREALDLPRVALNCTPQEAWDWALKRVRSYVWPNTRSPDVSPDRAFAALHTFLTLAINECEEIRSRAEKGAPPQPPEEPKRVTRDQGYEYGPMKPSKPEEPVLRRAERLLREGAALLETPSEIVTPTRSVVASEMRETAAALAAREEQPDGA